MEQIVKTANKGEWAELYVFFKIVLDRIIYAADKDLTPKLDEWFKFVNLYRHISKSGYIKYDLSEKDIVKVLKDGMVQEIVDSRSLRQNTVQIFNRIKTASATFAVSDAVNLMNKYNVDTIKAGSSSKTDIDADVIVSNNPSIQRMGFSVKSYIGGAPTLVNSSSHTNFVYEVKGFDGDIQEVNSINTRSKVRDRISAINANGGILEFSDISSECFRKNLRLQDSLFPSVISKMLLLFYSGKGNDFKILGDLIAQDESFDVTAEEITTMTKRYLRSSALGMVPGTQWEGKLSTQGGYIVVLESGELLCYNIYFDDDFQEYLYTNTRLDTPSSSRNKFGILYENNGKLFFNLNLQIRFKRI